MNRETIKEVANWLMIIGATSFTCGAGAKWICRRIDKQELADVNRKLEAEQELANRRISDRLEAEAKKTKLEQEAVYTEQLKKMDAKEFARHHAERIAKANQDVIDKAENAKRENEAMLAKVRMECTEAITKARQECLEKITQANLERDEAVSKYQTLDALFTNKAEVLKAKSELDALNKREAEAKKRREDLMNAMNINFTL